MLIRMYVYIHLRTRLPFLDRKGKFLAFHYPDMQVNHLVYRIEGVKTYFV